MPQMQPINWLFISIMTVTVLCIIICVIYFSFHAQQVAIKETNDSSVSHFSFKW